jgi:SAM-dependent methyltransferase
VPISLHAGRIPVYSQALGVSEDQFEALARWIAEIAAPTDALLEIGAGDGDDKYFGLVRPLVGRIVGVDPDPHSSRHAGLDEWHRTTVEEFSRRLPATTVGPDQPNLVPGSTAADPLQSPAAHGSPLYDLALAVYVVEHVAKPVGFFQAARACLRPGGSLFVVTPNLWHYFGVLAKAATALGIEERLLDALRAERPEHHGVAHFSVAYRANSVSALRRIGQEAGYSALEIRHLDNPAVFEAYFPGWSVAFPRWYSAMVHRIGRTELFGTLICRFVN